MTHPSADNPHERLCGISLQLADESLAARTRALAEDLARQAQGLDARDKDLQTRQAALEEGTAAHVARDKELQARHFALDQEVARRVTQAQKAHFSPPVTSSPIRADPNAEAFGTDVANFNEDLGPIPRHPASHGVEPVALAETLTSALTGVLQNQNDSNMQLAALIKENLSTKRKASDEPPAPAKRIELEAGPDDAETVWHHQARNLRPFRGQEWQDRYTHLGRHATPVREDLAWEPMGVIEVAPVIIKKLHDRGAELQIKMFSPINVDVACRSGRFHMSEDGESVSIKSHDFKPVLQTWQVVEALTTYTLCLHRVWPEDWTGLALTRILNHYRWLAPSGRAKVEQVKLITNFIDTVFTKNAARGRENKAPYSFKEIEQVMETIVWSKNVDKASCLGTNDPFASSNHRAATGPGPAALHHYGPSNLSKGTPRNSGGPPIPRNNTQRHNYNRPSGGPRASGDTHRGNPRSSGHSSNMFRMTMAQKFAAACPAFNSRSGCSVPNCSHQHRCTFLLDARNMCLKPDHGSPDHA